jgi:DNA-directed RNA polymerase subunit RPC12/RpoP
MASCFHCESELQKTDPPEGIVDGRQYYVCPNCGHRFVEIADEAGQEPFSARLN